MIQLGIVGSGIAGLGLAYYMREHAITIFEQDSRIGGHSNTVLLPESGLDIPVDTGFMVFNRVTYPNLTKLFDELSVPVKKTDMSFSVSNHLDEIEFAGASFNRLFGDRRNLLNLRFWRMLLQLDRFNREALLALATGQAADLSLADYVRERGYGDDFFKWYLLPMSSSVWSSPSEEMLKFPAQTLLRFFHNHGFLGQTTQHQWWTVHGGSREYVKRLTAKLPQMPKVRAKVLEVRKVKNGAQVITEDGSRYTFDRVVLACHADQALAILARPTDLQRSLLSAFRYQRNDVAVHIDQSVMPEAKGCWSSWNYRVDDTGASTHYWMNSLQDVSKKRNYFVSLGGHHLIQPEYILKSMVYHHPLFDMAAIKAQRELDKLNRDSSPIHFCGSYFGYGFHEDALNSSLQLAAMLKEASNAPIMPV